MSELVKEYLQQNLWPWPLVVAYSLEANKRSLALEAVATQLEHLEAYPGTVRPAYCAMYAMGEAVLKLTNGGRCDSDLVELERPLLRLFERGELHAWGRPSEKALLEPINANAWLNAEITYDNTCDLGPRGWRAASDDWLNFSLPDRTVWFWDIHVPADEVYRQFGPLQSEAEEGYATLVIRWDRPRPIRSPLYATMPEVFDAVGGDMFPGEGNWTGEEVHYQDLGEEFPHPDLVLRDPMAIAEAHIDLNMFRSTTVPEKHDRCPPSGLSVKECDAHIISYDLYDKFKERVCSWLGLDASEENKLTHFQWSRAYDYWIDWRDSRKNKVEKRRLVFSRMFELAQEGALPFRFVSREGDMRKMGVNEWGCPFEVAVDRFNCDGLSRDPRYLTSRPASGINDAEYYAQFHGELQVLKADLAKALNQIASPERVGPSVDTALTGSLETSGRAVMPAHAGKSERDHEMAAHRAAEIVRERRCSASAAFLDVLASVPESNRSQDSVVRAIRRAFNLMYDNHGQIKN